MDFKVVPSEAGWMENGVFKAGNYSGTAWLIGTLPPEQGGAGGFVHLVISPQR